MFSRLFVMLSAVYRYLASLFLNQRTLLCLNEKEEEHCCLEIVPSALYR